MAAPPAPEEWRQAPLIRVTKESKPASRPAPITGRWKLPPLHLLKYARTETGVSEDEIRAKAALIEETLASFAIEATVAEAIPGPVVTQYLLRPGAGVKVAKITALASDLALKLAAKSIRIEAPVPGQPYVGVETPNDAPAIVSVREVMESDGWEQSRAKIKVALGKDVAGAVRVADLTAMPHLLVAGATGAGKSVCLTALLTCLICQLTPDELQLILIDPKMVELVTFDGIPHLRLPVITDVNETVPVLTWVTSEMARRYRLFNKAGARNVTAYNASPTDETNRRPLPYIVVLIDELADLMMTAPGDVERLLARLAQMARATGIHLVISTQRPSVDVITGLIKANFPTRVAFMVSSQADSRTILDHAGAERLIGRGDMLYAPPDGGKPVRIQGVYAGDEEIKAVVEFWRQQGEPELVSRAEVARSTEAATEGDEALYVEATELVMRHESITPDLVSRELGIGRTLAMTLIHRLEEEGFVGPPEPLSLRRPVLQHNAAE
ncbi:MAG: DNA translocase FtsK [Actinobacteria bacterium]|nr:DNA translocase FtsK [Actinomycetota bacterium]